MSQAQTSNVFSLQKVAKQSRGRNVSIWYINSKKGNQFTNIYKTYTGKKVIDYM